MTLKQKKTGDNGIFNVSLALIFIYHLSSFTKRLLKFLGEPDPMLAMVEWLCHKMMEVEVENKLGAGKGEHSPSLVQSGPDGKLRTILDTIGVKPQLCLLFQLPEYRIFLGQSKASKISQETCQSHDRFLDVLFKPGVPNEEWFLSLVYHRLPLPLEPFALCILSRLLL